MTVDCTGAVVSSLQIPADYPGLWDDKTINFIVLSPRIDPNDIYWEGLTLKSRNSDDQLTVSENCFTVVPSADAPVEAPAEPPAQ